MGLWIGVRKFNAAYLKVDLPVSGLSRFLSSSVVD